MTKRNPHYIGDCEYKVKYKEHEHGKDKIFVGFCENFNTMGLSAFWNDKDEQMLLVHYHDIVGLYPLK